MIRRETFPTGIYAFLCNSVAFVLFMLNPSTVQANDAAAIVEARCEMQIDPRGIDTTAPRLSWTFRSDRRASKQTAYRVLAASDPEHLAVGKADLWDSGRVDSEQSLLVPYAGQTLRSDEDVFWTVKIWTNHGEESAWSKPSRWTMGLLSPSDWHGQWIGATEDLKPIQWATAKWICYPTSDPSRQADESWVFTRRFEIPAGQPVVGATLNLRSDDHANIEVNGKRIADAHWGAFDCGDALKSGAVNELRITVTNFDVNGPNPAGLIARLEMAGADGRVSDIVTDAQWHVARAADPNRVEIAQELGDSQFHLWADMSQYATQTIPILRRDLTLEEKPVKRVVLHLAGLGQYRLLVNGQAARESILDQDWSSYEKTVFYDSYDITALLNGNRLCLGVMLGKGNYSNIGDRRIHVGVRHRPLAMKLQGRVEYADGTTAELTSDGAWRWSESPYTHNAIVGGVDYDARLLPEGWALSGFDASQWKRVRKVDWPFGTLIASRTPPLRTFEAFTAKTVEEPEFGHFVYDFVQNTAATVRLKVRGKAGQKLRLTYGEQRLGATDQKNNGKGLVNQAGIGTPNYIEYTCRGDVEETWLCDLFYTGFQYVEVTGAVPVGHENPDELPVLTELTSLAVHADVEPVGKLSFSDPLLERIDHMIDWAVKSNLSYVLTDCPQREKFGWLEVPHLMWPSLVSKYDLSRFGPKICRDIRDTQSPDGRIVNIAPSFIVNGYHFNGTPGIGYTIEWGAAGVLIPWHVYSTYGDTRCLSENYNCMKRFVDYVRSTVDEDLVPPDGGLGDWYDFGHGKQLGPSQFTPSQLTAMAIFHDCARRVGDAARVLRKPADEANYRALAADIADHFNRKYLDVRKAEYTNNGSCQTANAMAIACGIAPPDLVPQLVESIVADLERRHYQQTSGDVGFHYLIRALAGNGRSDVVYRLLQRTEVGSYGFLANNGWSALPEAWNADTNSSMNHCMLGHIEEFFTQDICGIKPLNGEVAFKTFTVRPSIAGGPAQASYSFKSPYGIISTRWTNTDNRFDLELSVPANAEAIVHLPPGIRLTESGSEVDHAPGVLSSEAGIDGFALRVGSGAYRFTVTKKQ